MRVLSFLLLLCILPTNVFAFVGWILEAEDQVVEASRYAEERVWRGKMLTTTVQSLKNAKEMYDNAVSIKDFAQRTRDLTDSVRYNIQKVYDLQYDARRNLAAIKSLQHLKWTDVADLASLALDVDVNPTHWDMEYFDLKKNSPLVKYFGDPEDYDYTHTDINGLYKIFGPTLELLVEKPIRANKDVVKEDKEELKNSLVEGLENSLLLQQSYRKVLLDASFKYEVMSEEYAKRAIELEEALKSNDALKLSHGEQLQMYFLMNQYVAQSLEFKIKAAEYRMEGSKKTEQEINLALTKINRMEAIERALRQIK